MRPSIQLRALAGTAVLLAVAQQVGLTGGIDRWLGDQHWRWSAAQHPGSFPDNILVIGIDDASVRELGRLRNWSRARYAQLLDRLHLAAAVGIDVLFVDPDLRDAAGDRALADAVRRHGKVVLAFHQWTTTRPLAAADLASLEQFHRRLATAPVDADCPRVRAELLQPPLPALVSAAAGLGSADVTADPDGVYRRPVLLQATSDGRLVPHLALSVAALASGARLADVVRRGQLQLGERAVPLAGGAVLLRPLARSPGFRSGTGRPVPSLSLVAALRAPPATFAGKLVLVGETATGTGDIRPNALDPGLRGVELNADILANLLALRPARPLAGAWQLAALLLVTGAPLLLFSRFRPGPASVGSAACLATVLAGFEAAFWNATLLPSWGLVLLGSGSATLLMGLQRLAVEQRAKEQVRRSFSLYVAPEVVAEIVDHPDLASVEGRRQEVAVLFSDIRSFTAFCEHNPPEQVVRQMRAYLGSMADSVQAHRGVLDKFIGDAVMALWGPFLDDGANPAALAVACGLDMQARLAALNTEWEAAGLPRLQIGIGVHHGEAIVGNIGSLSRMQYTALGDAVNLASRLESNTKDLHVAFVASREVRDAAAPALADRVHFRHLGSITVRNREQPVEVYEVTLPDDQETPHANPEASQAPEQ